MLQAWLAIRESQPGTFSATPSGNVLFAPPDLSGPRPLEVIPDVPVTVAMSPGLLAPNRFRGFE